MAKTSRERQAALRARRAGNQREINGWVSPDAYDLLKRRADRDGVTLGEALEAIIVAALEPETAA